MLGFFENEAFESLPRLVMLFPQTSVMLPPDAREYSALNKEMPALSLFVHRAMDKTQLLNEQIALRNARIGDLAREVGSNTRLTEQRALYYSSMLADDARAISTYVDDALFLWDFTLDQIKEYMAQKAKGETHPETKFGPKIIGAMPDKELRPKLRAQLVTFEE